MSTRESPGQAETAAEAIALGAAQFGALDPVGFGRSLLALLGRAGQRPGETGAAVVRYWSALAGLGPVTAARWLGLPAEPVVPVPAGDKRFADPAWQDNPLFAAIRQAYLATCQLADDLLAVPGDPDGGGDQGAGSPVTGAKARLAADLMLAALAPTNFLLTNPAAVKRAFETGGASVLAGARNFLGDLARNQGRPRQVDTRPFRIGTSLAATPGKVVYRNDLIELIQYAPQTPKVRRVPMLASPPWINKYYIMDLAPGRSFLEWAVRHERTVFAISYRNPDASMRAVTMDDYLVSGPLAALDVIGDITGSDRIDVTGLCLGGALAGMLAAYLAATGDDRLGSLTLLNTMLDYSRPGVLGTFTDERTVAVLERQMNARGYLDGGQMSAAFDLLRPNDLIFSYVVSGWLMGQQPPPFDLLAWNCDSTRMPAAMHSAYLRSLYLRNDLARGRLRLAGQRLALGKVSSDAYVVGAVNDHIVPWMASYQATRLLGGNVRYVLSSGGHVAGIVNPPGPKAWYEASAPGDRNPRDADSWRAGTARQAASWWQDWTRWAGERAGDLVRPPRMGSKRYPAAQDAPGEYVLG
jgi:polyhydroxyalkanoate synthase